MAFSSPSITNAQFLADIVIPSVVPIVDDVLIKLPINFSSVANLVQFNGSYTPNNDYLYLIQNGTPFATSPNFMICICDAQLNVSLVRNTGTQFIAATPVMRFGFFSWAQTSSDYLAGMFLEGRTAVEVPMPQGTPVNYTVIFGQANIS